MSHQPTNVLDQIQSLAASDPAFRERLRADPRGAIEAATGATLPAELNVRVVEQSPQEIYLVLPPTESDARELADAELDQVAGAGCPWCLFTKGTYCVFTK